MDFLMTGTMPWYYVNRLGLGKVRASFAARSASSLPSMPQCPGTHWMPTVALHCSRRSLMELTDES